MFCSVGWVRTSRILNNAGTDAGKRVPRDAKRTANSRFSLHDKRLLETGAEDFHVLQCMNMFIWFKCQLHFVPLPFC